MWNLKRLTVFSLSEAGDSDETQEEEALLDIDEEADLIQAERILVDADYQERNGRKRQRKKETDIEVDAMAELMLSMSINDTENHPEISEAAVDDEGFQVSVHNNKQLWFIGCYMFSNIVSWCVRLCKLYTLMLQFINFLVKNVL